MLINFKTFLNNTLIKVKTERKFTHQQEWTTAHNTDEWQTQYRVRKHIATVRCYGFFSSTSNYTPLFAEDTWLLPTNWWRSEQRENIHATSLASGHQVHHHVCELHGTSVFPMYQTSLPSDPLAQTSVTNPPGVPFTILKLLFI